MIVDFLTDNNRLVEACTSGIWTPERKVVWEKLEAIEDYYDAEYDGYYKVNAKYEFKSLLNCACLKKLAKTFYLWLREIPDLNWKWVCGFYNVRNCTLSIAPEIYFNDNPDSINFSANTTTVVLDSLTLIIARCSYSGHCPSTSPSIYWLEPYFRYYQKLDSDTDVTYEIRFSNTHHEFFFTLDLEEGTKITLDLPPCKSTKETYSDAQFVQALDKAIAMKFLKNEQAIISEGNAFIADTCLNFLDE